jgi:hypothetical protein
MREEEMIDGFALSRGELAAIAQILSTERDHTSQLRDQECSQLLADKYTGSLVSIIRTIAKGGSDPLVILRGIVDELRWVAFDESILADDEEPE